MCTSGVRIWGYLGGPWGGFFEFVVKRALKQDQIVHLEGKLQFILYFSRECKVLKLNCNSLSLFLFKKYSNVNNSNI